jgi:electron transfer flavoprotein beta subunit
MRKVSYDEVAAALKPNQMTIERLYIPRKTKQTEVIQGSPAEVAKKLVIKLRDEMRVL